jgi:hypothetical protein
VNDAERHAAHPSRERLLAEALELPDDERAELACSLLESIEAGDDDARSESRVGWADAWAAEVSKRLAAMDAGEPGITAAEALAALRRK